MKKAQWSPERILSLREELELTQIEFAERVGVRQATISNWETGKKAPSPMGERRLEDIRDGKA
ncbi:MAG: helix-turn-helix transcriptional regulator [bacterium]